MKGATFIYIFCFLFIIHVQKTYCQSYLPLLNDSFYWDVGIANNDVSFCQEYGYKGIGPYRFKMARDTTFNSTTYKMFSVYPFHQVNPTWPYNCGPFFIDTNSSVMTNGPYLREDTASKKVFVLDSTTVPERLLFDFDAQLGDTLHYPVYGNFIVDTIFYYNTLDGLQRKTYQTSSSGVLTDNYYMEGIGGTSGIFFEPFYYFEGGPWIMCVSDLNQTHIFDFPGPCNYFATGVDENVLNELGLILFPNPVHDLLQLNAITGQEEIIIYNNVGMIVSHEQMNSEKQISVANLQCGFYYLCIIQHGMKIPVGSFVKL